MNNPFRTPVPAQMITDPQYGGGPGANAVLPSQVILDDTTRPFEPNEVDNAVAAYRGDTGQLFQESLYTPGYSGEWVSHPGQGDQPIPGDGLRYAGLYPAPGSQDLTAPRDAAGIPGTDTLMYAAEGPVTGRDNAYTNNRAALYSETPGYNGPVGGGPDYSQQATRAYFQVQAQQYSQAATEAAMLAAI